MVPRSPASISSMLACRWKSSSSSSVDRLRECFASAFTDRAVHYRAERGFDHLDIAVSVGIMRMVRSDLAVSGVMFTLDTETGFRDVVLINASYGLGEPIVQGSITPDEYCVFKPTLEAGFRPISGLFTEVEMAAVSADMDRAAPGYDLLSVRYLVARRDVGRGGTHPVLGRIHPRRHRRPMIPRAASRSNTPGSSPPPPPYSTGPRISLRNFPSPLQALTRFRHDWVWDGSPAIVQKRSP